MNSADLFFALPLKDRHLLLDSEYHPRVAGDKAAKKSATSQIDVGQYVRAVAKESAEPRKLPADWQIGDEF